MNTLTAISPADTAADASMVAHEWLLRAHRARVYDVAHESTLADAPLLAARLDRRVLLKREDEQPVFSFKLRGAYNRMVKLDPAERARGVVTASAGNHAQGVALAAARLEIAAVIVMPVTAPQVKIDAVRRFGGRHVEVVLAGDSYSETQAAAERLQRERDSVFVHPFDDPDVIAGQATVGLELLRQCPRDTHAVFVPVGGGGLLAGIATCIKAVRPDVKVIGVQSMDSDAMARSLEAGVRVTLADVGLFADGTAVKRVGKRTFELCRHHVDAMVRVDNDAVCAAIGDIYHDTRRIPEPSGALALAGLKQYAADHGDTGTGALVAVVSGANMNFDRLRFVAERARVGDAREAVLAVTIPEQRGSFRRFCAALGCHDITEFNYRISHSEKAHLFVGIKTGHGSGREALIAALRAQHFDVLDLTADELAKSHLRHMVGGRSALAHDERLYSFSFPERPGALPRFLERMHPNGNISLFHYHNDGADHGRILVGIQVSSDQQAALEAFVKTLGYPHRDESRNPACRWLLQNG